MPAKNKCAPQIVREIDETTFQQKGNGSQLTKEVNEN